MKSDLDMICHHFTNDIIVYPVSDVHLGACEHMQAEWYNFTQEILKQPNAYIILNGDLINNATRSSVSNIFEETMRPRDQKKLMVEMLTPIKDRILCAVSGNHERRSIKDADDDPTYDIMCKLDLEDLYRPNMAFVKLGFGTRKSRPGKTQNTLNYTVGVTHGSGGGIYTGATVNRNERFGNVIDGLDCLIVGHTHKGTVTKPSKLVIDCTRNTVYQRNYTVISSESWQKYGGYAMQKMLLPGESGNPQMLKFNKKEKNLTVTW